MTMAEEDSLSSDEEVPTLVPMAGIKRKLQPEKSEAQGEDVQETRKKLLKLTKKIKAPTSEELTRLRETENLFHSNMFRLQIEEMLKEVKPKENIVKKVTEWGSSIMDFLKNLESDETMYNLDDWSQESGVRLPLAFDVPTDPKTSFQFLKPAGVRAVGSVPAGCGFGSSTALDVAVEMPKRMLLKGDHLNERYWRKKLAYMSSVAVKLNQASNELKIQSVEYKSNGLPELYHCSLQITPVASISKKMKLHIYVIPEEKGIKQSACYPQASNIRPTWGQSSPSGEAPLPIEAHETGPATPMYNTLLARDVNLLKNEEYRRRCFDLGGDGMRDAYLLLCVWLEQRQLCHGAGTLSRFALALYLCYLLESKKLHSSMSSYQMLRNLWVQLSCDKDDWTRPCASDSKKDSPVKRDEFLKCFPVVFLDASGLCNMTAAMTSDYYRLLKEEARLAVSCLDDINLDSFRYLFMTPAPFLRQFDHYMCFNSIEELRAVALKQGCADESLDRGSGVVARFANLLVKFLMDSVGERIAAITYRIYPTQVLTPVDTEQSEPETEGLSLVVGIRLNSETCFKLIHRGPEANLPEAAEFRRLWGAKAELRRFKDGTVCEATVWGSNQDPWTVRRLVTREIIGYLLSHQWGMEEVVYLADEVERAVASLNSDGKKKNKAPCAGAGSEEATVAILQEWDALARCSRDMKSLPLDICSVLPTAEVLRYTDPLPPRPYFIKRGETGLLSMDSPLPPYVKPIEGVIEVTASGKWPEDLDAIARLKAAFYLELSERLYKEHKIVSQVHSEYLDVYKAGYVFRLRLLCTPEVTLLKKQIQHGVVRYKNTTRSVAIQQQLVHLPVLHSALHGLHQAHPVLGPGLCLVKRWLARQLLLDCGPNSWASPAVELLGASLCSPPAPYYAPPLNPQTFLLRYLALLSAHNFATDPVLVNISGELARNDILHIEARLRNDRGTLPAVTLLTPWDGTGQLWTKQGPIVGTLARTVALARAALHLMEARLVKGLGLQSIFEFPRADFDVLIGLNKSAVCKLRTEEGAGQDLGSKVLPVVDFDPASLYVDALRESYGDIALFLYDVYGGLEIGVVLKPEHLQSDKDLKLNCKRPAATSQDAKLSLVNNTEAMYEDMYILGRGLVRSVTSRESGLVESPFRTVLE